MNPYAILGLVIAWGATTGGAFLYGQNVGREHEVASVAKLDKAIRDTREAAQLGAAAAIAKIEVKNVTINRKLETSVREKPVFRDCRSGADVMRLYNSGIPGYTEPASDSSMPGAPAPAR